MVSNMSNAVSFIRIKFWNKKTLKITDYDPVYKVIYLGNVLTPWAKGEGILDKPLATLWKNFVTNLKHEVRMKLTICSSGLKAITREHGLTEYWANRITYCGTHPDYPRVFCWIYRHEGRKMKQELRCHAVLCNKESKAQQMATALNERLAAALREYRREKRVRQNARLSLASSCQEIPAIPIRKQLLIKGLANFRPPLERSKSAPRLTSIEETMEEEYHQGFDEEDEEEEEEYLRLGGSVSSEGQETTSDIVPDDFDSISEQFTGLNLGLNGNPIYSNNSGSLDQVSGFDPNSLIVEAMPNPACKRVNVLKSIHETGQDEEEDEEEPDCDNISSESGYSETGDAASSVKSSNNDSS